MNAGDGPECSGVRVRGAVIMIGVFGAITVGTNVLEYSAMHCNVGLTEI